MNLFKEVKYRFKSYIKSYKSVNSELDRLSLEVNKLVNAVGLALKIKSHKIIKVLQVTLPVKYETGYVVSHQANLKEATVDNIAYIFGRHIVVHPNTIPSEVYMFITYQNGLTTRFIMDKVYQSNSDLLVYTYKAIIPDVSRINGVVSVQFDKIGSSNITQVVLYNDE